MRKISQKTENQLLNDYKFMKKDKNTIPILCDLYCIGEEEVKEMIEKGKRRPAFRWDEDKRFKLAALENSGMKQKDIAKELGCTPQCLADFKRRERLAQDAEKSKRKELSTTAIAESSKKNISVTDTSSTDNYTTNEYESQEIFAPVDAEAFFEKEKLTDRIGIGLHKAIILLETARRAGVLWSCGDKPCECCEMYQEMLNLVLSACRDLEGSLDFHCEGTRIV